MADKSGRRNVSTAAHAWRLDEALGRLDSLAPGAPLAAFGQTPFWDEPVKILIAPRTTRRVLTGIHDLDYFSRIRTILPGSRWQIIGRNDGSWRDPWIAAGELSALFGAEIWPSRRRLLDAGVNLERMFCGRAAPAQIERATEGWGWRGVIENVARPTVICDMPAASALPAVRELLRWGFSETERALACRAARRSARSLGRELDGEAKRFVEGNSAASVADLYRALLRSIYVVLLGEVPANVEITGTRELFRFNGRTAGLPRFRFVSHFLDPCHAQVCRAAYDEAVKESAVSALGGVDGLLPFDVYAPGRGRGELRLLPDRLIAATEPPIEARLASPVRTVEQLAEVLEKAAGPELSLVGKAVALPAMMNGEFIMTLTETGSAYMPRTQRMLSHMVRDGVPLRANPLLRLRLRTWDSLAACNSELRLPEHLEQAFGGKRTGMAEFAKGWRSAVRSQERMIQRLRRAGSPCDLAEWLLPAEHDRWFERIEDCRRAQATLLEVQRQADMLRHEALDLQIREDEALLEIRQVEAKRGLLNREKLRPLKRRLADAQAASREDAPAAEELVRVERQGRALLMALESKQAERRGLRRRRGAVVARLRALESAGKAARARRALADMERMTARARLRLARNAILAADSLTHSDARPAAWWFPAVDPSGRWFERVSCSARARLEPLADKATTDAH